MTYDKGRRHLLAALPAIAVAGLLAGSAGSIAGEYPERQVTLIVPFPAGGVVDGVARIVANQLEQQTGQSWIIDNRGGAGGTIGAQHVAVAEPDGYTLLMSSTGIVSITPNMMEVPFDPAADFSAVSMVGFSNGVLAVHPSVPAETVGELVEYARAHPGELFFASSGIGTIAHLYGEIFNAKAGVQIDHVPFGGSAPALTDTIAGRAQVIFDTVAVPAARDGQLRGLAVLGATANPLLPDLPTLRETGYDDTGVLAWFGILGPAGLPDDVVSRLNVEIEKALQSEEVTTRLMAAGITPRFEDSATFAETMKHDRAVFGEVIERLGIEN